MCSKHYSAKDSFVIHLRYCSLKHAVSVTLLLDAPGESDDVFELVFARIHTRRSALLEIAVALEISMDHDREK